MADRTLNEISSATDFATAYTEDASGNQVKISKADMASVLAASMGNPIGSKGLALIANIDALTTSGIYIIDEPSNITINNWSGIGMLVSYATTGSYRYLAQLFFHMEGLIAFRVSRNGGTNWQPWKEISTK